MRRVWWLAITALLLPIAIGAAVVYTKQVQEKEQLVLEEVRAFVMYEENITQMPGLLIRKPGLLTGYEDWQVEREDTKEMYQYMEGKVVKVRD